MKIKVYALPNGRKYFITLLSDKQYHILTLITADEILKKENNPWVSVTSYKYKLCDRWTNIAVSATLEDALQTLCLFAHHNANDTDWLEQFSYEYETTQDDFCIY